MQIGPTSAPRRVLSLPSGIHLVLCPVRLLSCRTVPQPFAISPIFLNTDRFENQTGGGAAAWESSDEAVNPNQLCVMQCGVMLCKIRLCESSSLCLGGGQGAESSLRVAVLHRDPWTRIPRIRTYKLITTTLCLPSFSFIAPCVPHKSHYVAPSI